MQTGARLRKRAEFLDVRERGRRVSDRLIVLGVVLSDGGATRFGLVVDKRVGGAVTRNRVKRRLRECLRSLEFAPGYNIVVSARPAAAEAGYHILLSSVRRLARRAGVVPPRAADPAGNSRRHTARQNKITQSKITGKAV